MVGSSRRRISACSRTSVSALTHKRAHKGTHLEENGASERKLHLPSSREGSDGGLLAIRSEADRLEDGAALGLRLEDTRVLENERDDRVLGLVSVDVVLDVEGTNLVRRRESLDLSVVDRALYMVVSAPATRTRRRNERRRTMRVDFPEPLRPQRP